MPEEFGEQLTRDQRHFLHSESLQILQIHSSMLVLLLFVHLSFSEGFRSEDWDIHGKRLIVSSVTHFVFILDYSGGRSKHGLKKKKRGSSKMLLLDVTDFLTEAVRFWFFICWIHEAMHLNKMFRTSGRKKQAHNIKDSAVYLTVDMAYFFIPVCTKLIWWVCSQKSPFSFIWP